MKTKITLFLLILQFGLFAQDNWTSVFTNGNGVYQSRFYDLVSFQNRLYAASDSGYLTPTLYSSNGFSGSWVRENGITPLLQGNSEDLFSRLATNGTNLFIGSANYSGGFNTPQVYRFDGSTFSKHDSIPYSQSQFNYIDISAMEFFSVTGSPDSLFVFVSSYSGMEVWKTSATSTTPTWVLDLAMSPSTSIVNDAILFNNNLYVATCGDANGGFILKTADGLDWDTVGYGGFGNNTNTAIKSLAIYNGELFAGTQNSGGAQLYKSADGNTWNNVPLSLPGLNPTMATSISDILVSEYRMFLDVKKDSAAFSFSNVFWTINGSTFYSSTGGTPINTTFLQSGFGEPKLGVLNNNIYATDNTSGSYGFVYELLVPQTSVGVNSTGICRTSTFLGYGSSSTNTASFEWILDDTLISTLADISYQMNYLGNHTMVIKTYNGGIYDSTYLPMLVTPEAIGSVSASPSDSVCAGQPVTIQFNYVSGALPFQYQWSSPTAGYPAQGNFDNFSFIPSGTGDYILHTYNVYSCTIDDTIHITVKPNTDISGNISYSGGAVNNGNVYIINYQPGSAGGDTVAVSTIFAGGGYFQAGIPYGNYLIKAEADTTIAAYSNTISTYNGGAFRWDSASPILHTCSTGDLVDITVLELPAQNGTATISGYLTEGFGFGTRMMNPTYDPFVVPGGPLKGIDVKLGKNPAGGIQARTTSDTTSGRFEFTNVPVGDYRIYVDIPNLPMDSLREVTVTAGTDSIPNNNYIADSASIYIDNPISIKSNESSLTKGLHVYPNPAHDFVTIEYESGSNSESQLSITDIVGRKVFVSETKKQYANEKIKQTLNLSELPNGVYFIQLQVNDSIETFKLNITH